MDAILLETGFSPDEDELLRRVGLERDSDEAEDFLGLVGKMLPLAKPKAALAAVPVEMNEDSGMVALGGVTFHSQLLAEKLAGAKTVWPHMATCGRELYDFARSVPDPFERYWCDEIMQAALNAARAEMMRRLEREFAPGKVAALGPGSLKQWPIEEQAPLFALMREGAAFCGIELTPTMLMLPNKSVSGILFPSEDGWESCSLCPREKCPNRRAPYNADTDA